MGMFQSDGKAILGVFIGALIALTFLGVIADSVFSQTNIITVTNVTVTGLAENVSLDLEGRDLIELIEIYNATNVSYNLLNNGSEVASGLSSTTGLQSVQLTLNNTALNYSGQLINISYTANPDGFASSTSQPVILLIVIFGALAILVFTIIMFIKEGTLGRLIRGERLA